MAKSRQASGKPGPAQKGAGIGDLVAHPGKPLAGKHPRKATAYDPAAQPSAELAAAAGLVVDRPRPAKTRYPIDLETFNALKTQAKQSPRTLARPTSELVADTGRKKAEVELATAAPAAVAATAPLPEAPAATPVTLANFAGTPTTGWYPPDCTVAVGPQHILVAVNSSVAVYNKAGAPVLMPRPFNLWFANVIANAKIFDPRVLYDQHDGRWIIVALALPLDPAEQSSWFLLSVSKTSDPLGGWLNYKLDAATDGTTATNNWADFPGLGVDHQALYLSANMFRFNGGFQHAKIRVIPKAAAYSGATLTFTDLTRLKNADGSLAFTVQPCHTFGAPTVEFFVNSLFPDIGVETQNQLTLWSLSNPLSNPSLSKRTISVDPYGLPPEADQKGSVPPLSTNDVRVLGAVFHGGSVWTALTTQHDWGDGISVAACQWFQIDATSGMLIQQGIYGARRAHYFYPALAPDTNGNLTMVFCRSAPSEYASIRFTGRRSTDPPGRLQSSILLKAGTGPYAQLDGTGRNRWGDYSSAAIDPADGRLAWFYSMYATDANAWASWIGSARF
ncbi:MAG: hypothetical protein IRY99_15230 [Isosphaeraceae bacterium]|nr:hypothetical protein [Isosphaeraceae bacterium]